MANGSVPYVKGVNFLSQVYTGDDLDNYYNLNDCGLYYVRNGVLNAPVEWCALVVVCSGGGSAFQMIIAHNGVIYIRDRAGNPPQWQSWYRVNGTIVS